QANRADTVPSPAILASKASPGFTGTIGPSAPESTTSPARSGRLRRASSPASQAIALSGLPRQAAPVPFETAHRPSEDEETRRRVVGDGIDDADVPIGDAAADDLEGGHRVGHRPQH